ncbi:MAG TPA: hypothetical protein VIH71_07615 [Solirubrobacteraceae bacterium]
MEGVLTGRQIQGLEKRYESKLEGAELTPYRNEARENTANEQGAQGRYAQYAATDNQLLSNLTASQEASAKTTENQAADSALQAGKAIETSGQTQASMTGGYVSPELRAELNAEASRQVAAGEAGNTFAQSTAQAGSNLLQGIRGAAALRSVEGEGKVGNYFQKNAAQIQQKESEVIPKVAARAAEYGSKISSENAKEYINLKSLGIKALANQSKETHEAAENRKYAVEIPQREADTRKAEVETLAKAPNGFDQWAKREELAIKKLSSTDKAKYDEALSKIKEGGQGSVADGLKYMGSVESAMGYAKAFIQREKAAEPHASTQQIYTKVRSQLQAGSGTGKEGEGGKGYDPAIVSAAMNLAVYGRLGTVEAAEAMAQGLNPVQKPAWFKGA